MNIKKIKNGLTQIKLPIPRGGFESFINSWLIEDSARQQTLLIETGPASAVPGLISDLKAIGCEKINYLIYTHIHLDHSGGAGQFCSIYGEAKVVAPLKGRIHLVSPERLVAGSRNALGDLCDVYGMPLPLSAESFLDDRKQVEGLDIVDTPGHAPHHNSYIYELDSERILFAGEAAGCCFELDDGELFMRPATPHKFFYDQALSSLNKLRDLQDISMICFPHSGCYKNVQMLLDMATKQLRLWREITLSLPDSASAEDFIVLANERDPMMKLLKKLPESVRRRESFFLRQSANGYLGARGQFS